jgi:hypothetical protein
MEGIKRRKNGERKGTEQISDTVLRKCDSETEDSK